MRESRLSGSARGAGSNPRPYRECARHGHRLGGEKSSSELVTASEANRRASGREDGVKEAGSEAAGRRTETGYEAAPSRASGLASAKLSDQGEAT